MEPIQFHLSKEDKDKLDSIYAKLYKIEKNYIPREAEQLLTRKETADFFKINLSSLWNWTKRGVLTSYSVQGRVYYKRSEVEAAIVELKQ